MATTAVEAADRPRQKDWMVVAASSLGTVFEWYDFFLYGLLATIISAQFFSGVNATTGFIFALGAFAAGFAVRPFGALVFGRLGDLVGRKNTFLVTMALMGLSTFAVGLLPSYAAIGIAAPILLVLMRLLQGLALGGEYGGAATYVGEHAPDGKRGLYTSFIQATATIGLFAALLVVIGTRTLLGEAAFADWGWRIPFLISLLLLGISLWIRLQLAESPAFVRMKAAGATSKAPIREAFGQWRNLKIVLVILAVVAGQAVTFYCGHFYALFFLEKTLKVDGATANILIAVALVIGAPFYVFFGWLSDKVGRKPVILAGLLLAVLTYFPLFEALTKAANPALHAVQQQAPVVVVADPGECSVQFDILGRNRFDGTSCDIAKAWLARSGISYANVAAPAGTVAMVRVGGTALPAFDPSRLAPAERTAEIKGFEGRLLAAVTAVGYPPKADPAAIDRPLVVAILLALVLIATMTYGPVAALLVESFPTRIRYTAMSLPYHIANGWFGGFLPTTAFALVAARGDVYFGLWYPIIVAAGAALIGLVFLKERHREPLNEEMVAEEGLEPPTRGL